MFLYTLIVYTIPLVVADIMLEAEKQNIKEQKLSLIDIYIYEQNHVIMTYFVSLPQRLVCKKASIAPSRLLESNRLMTQQKCLP